MGVSVVNWNVFKLCLLKIGEQEEKLPCDNTHDLLTTRINNFSLENYDNSFYLPIYKLYTYKYIIPMYLYGCFEQKLEGV